jgi:hypothetical protein
LRESVLPSDDRKMVIGADDRRAGLQDTGRTMKPDISESLVLHVDAAPLDVLAAVDRLGRDPFAGVREIGEREFAVTWHPAYGTTVDVTWDLRVEPDEDGGSYLSSTRSFHPADAASREALLANWRNVRAVAHTVARRTLRTIKRAAEEQALVPAPVELLLAA